MEKFPLKGSSSTSSNRSLVTKLRGNSNGIGINVGGNGGDGSGNNKRGKPSYQAVNKKKVCVNVAAIWTEFHVNYWWRRIVRDIPTYHIYIYKHLYIFFFWCVYSIDILNQFIANEMVRVCMCAIFLSINI